SRARAGTCPLSLHDALPILTAPPTPRPTLPPLLRTKWPTRLKRPPSTQPTSPRTPPTWPTRRRTRLKSPKTRSDPSREPPGFQRSEEHTSELQSRENLVCRL